MKKNYHVTGMTCQHCVANVEKALQSVPGVKKTKVNLKKAQASVTFEGAPLDEQIVEAVSSAGYGIEEF